MQCSLSWLGINSSGRETNRSQGESRGHGFRRSQGQAFAGEATFGRVCQARTISQFGGVFMWRGRQSGERSGLERRWRMDRSIVLLMRVGQGEEERKLLGDDEMCMVV